jgi:hypothetical protein
VIGARIAQQEPPSGVARVFQEDQALLGSRDAFGSEQKTAFFVLLVSKMAN